MEGFCVVVEVGAADDVVMIAVVVTLVVELVAVGVELFAVDDVVEFVSIVVVVMLVSVVDDVDVVVVVEEVVVFQSSVCVAVLSRGLTLKTQTKGSFAVQSLHRRLFVGVLSEITLHLTFPPSFSLPYQVCCG